MGNLVRLCAKVEIAWGKGYCCRFDEYGRRPINVLATETSFEGVNLVGVFEVNS